MGYVVKQSFFGIDGKPTDPKVMVPEGFVEYDKWGNMTYVAAGDGHGNLIYNPETGCSITRNEYDSRGNLLLVSYFDEKDKPITNKLYGYHKVKVEYTESGKEKQYTYFGTKDNPVSCKDGYHKNTYDYNEHEQVVRVSYYNTQGKASNCSYGFHKIEWSYNDSGTAVSRKYYNASNKLLLTQIWDGANWVDQVNWKPIIYEINANCPVSDDDNNLILLSAKVTGNNSCCLTFKIPYSKYEISIDNLDLYKQAMKYVIYSIKQELPSNVSIKGILLDNKNRELCKVTK